MAGFLTIRSVGSDAQGLVAKVVFAWVLVLAAPAVLGVAQSALAADDSAADGQLQAQNETFAIHGQFTYVEQETLGFNAPYEGPNSLSSNSGRETTDATLDVGAALWSGAEIWINSEIDQGFGLDNTVGVAGFPSAEAYKVGKKQPYLRLPRLFVRDTVNLDGERETVDAGANQLAGDRSVNRWIITIGKLSVGDIFDNNQYAHDPRADFLNWAAVDAGSFDYAADAWAYTAGVAAEWYHGSWAMRAGLFDLSDVPNSVHLDPGFHEFQTDLELEHRHEIGERSGRLLVTLFQSRARMGLLSEAVESAQNSAGPVDIAAVRRYRSRFGAALSLEQQIAPPLGVFIRAGKASGNVEAYDFTDVDRTLAAGLSL